MKKNNSYIKINNLNKHFLTLLVFLIAWTSCEMDIDMEFTEHTPVLVINSAFTPDSNWLVHVSRSVGYFEKISSGSEIIENATIIIKHKGSVVSKPVYQSKGYYIDFDNKPKPGFEYTIEVSAPGFETVKSKGQTLSYIPITDLRITDTLVKFSNEFFSGDYIKLSFELKDPPGENFYMLKVMLTDTFENWSTGEPEIQKYDIFVQTEDPGFNSIYGNLYLEDKLFDGKTKQINLLVDKYYYDLKKYLEVVLVNCTPEYYLYSRSYDLQRWNEYDPFSEPIPVFSNIENGYGIFAGFNGTIESVEW